MGRFICWVVSALYIGSTDAINAVSGFKVGMDTAEDAINCTVSAAAIPPAFNDTLVVSENSDCTIGGKGESEDGVGEELKTHCFCPANVSGTVKCLPTWDEAPSLPPTSNDNPHPNSQACIRECSAVMEG